MTRHQIVTLASIIEAKCGYKPPTGRTWLRRFITTG